MTVQKGADRGRAEEEIFGGKMEISTPTTKMTIIQSTFGADRKDEKSKQTHLHSFLTEDTIEKGTKCSESTLV